eukprot:TRINITY_DN38419_c0_g1_i2.p1 TRINITY_DN38419_c0_g1~~TRINITY_DN38419_c0_g1_i2.p1  ORF type:complete len:133 (-),score=23.34 TRINITY_DN38419_c0_g1_i2:28-426(-)
MPQAPALTGGGLAVDTFSPAVTDAAFLGDGSRIVVIGQGPDLCVFDVATCERVLHADISGGAQDPLDHFVPSAMAIDADGQRVALVGQDGGAHGHCVVQVRRLSDGQLLQSLPFDGLFVRSVSFWQRPEAPS